MTTNVPTLRRIIETDYLSLLAALAPIIGCILYLVVILFDFKPEARGWDPLLQENGAPFFFWTALAMICLGLLTLAWRVTRIRRVFRDGLAVPGTITHRSFFRDRGRLEYYFSLNDEEFVAGNGVRRSARTEQFHLGMKVTVIAAPDHPKQAFLKELYIDD